MQNYANVFLYRIGENDRIERVENATRQAEINDSTSEERKKELYFGWRLLTGVLSRFYGIAEEDADLKKLSCGKWVSPLVNFSLSHKDGNIVLAVCSNSTVGVDIESRDRIKKSLKYAKKWLTDEEYSDFEGLNDEQKADRLLLLWTAKESIFKRGENDVFMPKNVPVNKSTTHYRLLPCGVVFGLSVAVDAERVRYYSYQPEKESVFVEI